MALEDGQAGTELAPNPMDDLVALLRDDATADLPTEVEGRESVAAAGEHDNPDDSTDLVPDEQIEFDPDRPLSPNGNARAAAHSRSGEKQTPATGQQGAKTFQVTVKGEDGADQVIEVDEKERGAGYLRHGQFTKLTQELATQRAQVMEVADQRIQHSHQAAHAAMQRASGVIARLAGFKTDAEMLALAQTDPAAYQAESARVALVKGEIAKLDAEAAAIVESSKKATEDALGAAYVACWSELDRMFGLKKSPEGDAKLKACFDAVIREYGIPAERFKTINDPKLIAMMFDAVELRELKSRAKTVVTPALKAAPRMPAQRQNTPRESKVNRELDGRFARARGGSTSDLAAWLATNKM
jgi:hypothetical protein